MCIRDSITSLLLKVVTQRNFIADFLRENPIFYTKKVTLHFFAVICRWNSRIRTVLNIFLFFQLQAQVLGVHNRGSCSWLLCWVVDLCINCVVCVCVVVGDETRCLLRRDLSSLLLASRLLRPSSTRDTLWAVYQLKCHVTVHWNREPSSLCDRTTVCETDVCSLRSSGPHSVHVLLPSPTIDDDV